METNEPQYIQRIQKELLILQEKGGIDTELIINNGTFVLYRGIKTGGSKKGLPVTTDVLVPVPSGYPSAFIDMPALPADSLLIPHVIGGSNPQYIFNADGRQWSVLSYHPYSNGGAPPWNPMLHGFYDYYNHLFTWLHNLI